jgi:hypothetical protein
VYASVVDGKTLTFFVSGKLWGRSLVMGDTETGSDWSHILGRSMAGPLEGKTLEMIPSVMTNWRSWLEKHPDTTATMIESTAGRFATEMLHSGREFGLGLVHDGKARFKAGITGKALYPLGDGSWIEYQAVRRHRAECLHQCGTGFWLWKPGPESH